jgi:enoyl-CoA hydratase
VSELKGYRDYQRLQLDRQGRVLTVTIAGTNELNFIDGTFHTELSQIFADIAQDPETDAVVLTATGRCFCAGGDIEWFRGMTEAEKDHACSVEGRKIILDLLELPQPIISAVHGPAIGLGATLALFCDIVVAAPDAVFADPHVVMGLVAGDGGAVIWPWLIGMNRAKEFLLTGDRVKAEQAERIGLVNRVVPRDEMVADAHAQAQRLAGGWQKAIRGTKTSVNKILRDQVNLVLDTSLAIERQCMSSPDHEAAMAAFLTANRAAKKG